MPRMYSKSRSFFERAVRSLCRPGLDGRSALKMRGRLLQRPTRWSTATEKSCYDEAIPYSSMRQGLNYAASKHPPWFLIPCRIGDWSRHFDHCGHGGQIITCPFLNEGRVKFDVPAKLGDLSKVIDFDYPAKATRISFRETICHLLQWTKASPRVFA
jgi:hypothetical protein